MLFAGDVVGRKDGDDARRLSGLVNVHIKDASVGILAAENLGVQQTFEVEVIGKYGRTSDLVAGIGARHRMADDF